VWVLGISFMTWHRQAHGTLLQPEKKAHLYFSAHEDAHVVPAFAVNEGHLSPVGGQGQDEESSDAKP